jgi:nucleoside 2-deoxyribosyltransferase
MNNNKIKVYIAAGWFSEEQKKALSYIEKILSSNNKFLVYSPRKEIQLESGKIHNKEIKQQVFNSNINFINKCDLIISSTIEKDMGTLFECGYAYSKNIPIIYTLFLNNIDDIIFNLMLSESGIACFTNKKEFENFINKITKKNVKTIKQKYKGKIE